MDSTTCPSPNTWTDIIVIEPCLANLESEILYTTPPKPMSYEFWTAWEGYKRRMSRLVGWDARRPELASPALYDMAYRHLYDLYEIRAYQQRRRNRRRGRAMG